MSNYFFQRIKNLPTTENNSKINNSKFIQQSRTNLDVSDDELLTSALKFEQTLQYKQIEDDAEKVKGKHMFYRT